MAKRNTEERDIKSVLQEFIKTNRLDQGLDQVSVTQAWESVMGPPIVKYTTAVVLDRNTLYVSLSSSVLREELSYGKLKIIDLLNRNMQKEVVRKLVLR
ncbi:hypothetical protein SCB49_14370 [unidentified eubacterium SCB49]|nr:hypothetical protein SCB49_14370 [unidentified eubacterium SCB49]